jgi:hypothetical protein
MNDRSMANKLALGTAVVALLVLPVLVARARHHPGAGFLAMASQPAEDIFGSAEDNSRELIEQGRQVFRFDTFGDEAFWGDQLHLHEAIATLTPRQVLGLGLKVDADALPPNELQSLMHGRINLDDPAVTLRLLQQNAVLGVTGSSTMAHFVPSESSARSATAPSTIRSPRESVSESTVWRTAI